MCVLAKRRVTWSSRSSLITLCDIFIRLCFTVIKLLMERIRVFCLFFAMTPSLWSTCANLPNNRFCFQRNGFNEVKQTSYMITSASKLHFTGTSWCCNSTICLVDGNTHIPATKDKLCTYVRSCNVYTAVHSVEIEDFSATHILREISQYGKTQNFLFHEKFREIVF